MVEKNVARAKGGAGDMKKFKSGPSLQHPRLERRDDVKGREELEVAGAVVVRLNAV